MNSSNFSNEQRENAGGTGTSRYKLMQYLPFFVLFMAILLLFLMFLQRKSNAVGKEEAFSSDYSRAYGSYLAHLEEKEEAISSYVWQYSGQYTEDAGEEAELKEGKTVLLWDIFGDDTPELLYIEGNSGKEDGRVSQADLQVYSFTGGRLEPLCTMDSLDVFAGGGVNYTLFQIQGEKTLYLYREEYDGQMMERLYRLNNGSLPLSFEEIASHSYEAFGGEDVSEDVGENAGGTAEEGSADVKKENSEANKAESPENNSGQFTLHGKEVKEQEYLKLWEGLKKSKSHILLSNGKNSKFEESQDSVDVMQKTEDKASNTWDESQKPKNRPEKSTASSENNAKEQKNSINQPVTASVKNIALSYNEGFFIAQHFRKFGAGKPIHRRSKKYGNPFREKGKNGLSYSTQIYQRKLSGRAISLLPCSGKCRRAGIDFHCSKHGGSKCGRKEQDGKSGPGTARGSSRTGGRRN